jgi:hypothetical protein
VSCTLDRFGQLFLVIAAGACYTGGQDFTGFQGKTFQLFVVLVVDEFDFVFAKDTVLPAGEIELFLVFRGVGAITS